MKPRFRLIGIRHTIEGVTPQIPPEPVACEPADDDAEIFERVETPPISRVEAGLQSSVHFFKGVAFMIASICCIVLTVALAPILFLSIPAGIWAFGLGVNAVANFVYSFGHGAIAASRLR